MNSNKPLILLGILVSALVLLSTYFISFNNAKDKLHRSVENQLFQIVNELETTLERHSYLPALLSSDPAIKRFLKIDPLSEKREFLARQLQVSLSLELTNNISESLVIYVMRPDGTTVASSNWESESSFVGNNFSFRPYFKQAMQNILGRYYAVGAISGERGYFFASSVLENEKVIGVVAVKVAIDDIEFSWGQGAIDFMVTDPDGIIFLSSQPAWNLFSVVPLSTQQKSRVLSSRRYGSKNIQTLENTHLNPNKYDFQQIKLLGKNYEMLTKRMELADWDMRVFASHASMKQSILNALFFSSLILLLLGALAWLLWKTQLQRKKYQQQITNKLEKKVVERTQALKQTQEELIQAAKMAALGQLSAGITHEINNPLTAIRAYADNAKAFLQKNKLEMVESNLEEISALTESMATITRQLKSFSRKSKGQITSVSMPLAINNALSIVRPRLLNQSVNCHWDEKAVDPDNTKVLADEVWLGQILVNLLTNAIAATQDRENKDIWISIHTSPDSHLCVKIKDNGAGIKENNLPHIFEPFFTTKPSSKGLGLGLSISFNLAKEMNGSLSVTNHNSAAKTFVKMTIEESGAEFILCLPVSSE